MKHKSLCIVGECLPVARSQGSLGLDLFNLRAWPVAKPQTPPLSKVLRSLAGADSDRSEFSAQA